MMQTATMSDQHRTSFSSTETDSTNVHRLTLNHPKNYLAVPLAISASTDTRETIRKYAVKAVPEARKGAQELGLITDDGNLTDLGDTVTITGVREYGGPTEALEQIKTLQRSPKRFIDELPAWKVVAERIAFQYPPTSHLVDFLREQGELTLHEIGWLLWNREQNLAETILIHPQLSNRTTGPPNTSQSLRDQKAFRCTGPFQFKSMLYHCGILESRGKDTTSLNPTEDMWALDPDFK